MAAQVRNAAKALYGALDKSLVAYTSAIKDMEPTCDRELHCELYEFHYHHAANEILPIQYSLNRIFINEDLEPLYRREVHKERPNADFKDIQLVTAYETIRQAALSAIKELLDALVMFTKSDDAGFKDLSTELQNTRLVSIERCIMKPLNCFRTLERKAENYILNGVNNTVTCVYLRQYPNMYDCDSPCLSDCDYDYDGDDDDWV